MRNCASLKGALVGHPHFPPLQRHALAPELCLTIRNKIHAESDVSVITSSVSWSIDAPLIPPCASSDSCLIISSWGGVSRFQLQFHLQPVRDRYPALFSPACSTMQLFIWQPDTVGVAHCILDCFDFLGALLMLLMMRQPHLHQPWRLDRCNTYIHTYISNLCDVPVLSLAPRAASYVMHVRHAK